MKPKTIDDEINYAKTMVIKGFHNDKVSGNALKAFQRVKPLSEERHKREGPSAFERRIRPFTQSPMAFKADSYTWILVRNAERGNHQFDLG